LCTKALSSTAVSREKVTTPTSEGCVYQRSEQVPKTETTYSDEELGLNPGWDEPNGNPLDPNIRRELKQARIDRLELKTATAELSTYRRLASFATAGVPQDKRGQAFAKLYDGSDDPEEVKAAFEELFGAPEGAGTGASTEADQRIVDATNAGNSQGTPGTRDFGEALKGAKTMEEWREVMRNAPPEAKVRLPVD
jgi:hypothetical protein